MSTLAETRPPKPGRRTRVRGTGPLHEILPYYRWGMLAGVVGAFVVAVLFLIIDLAAGRPFATPTALGATLFLGAPFDRAQPPDWILIVGYSGVHGALSVGLALLVSSMVLGARCRPPPPASLALVLTGFFFAGLTLLFMGFLVSSSNTIASAPHIPLVLCANLLSATAMALVLNHAFQSRWVPESPLRPLPGRELDVVCLDETRVTRAGEIVVIPHDRPRAMSAKTEVTFLWTLAMETAP